MVDAGSGQDGIKAPLAGSGIMLFQNGFNHRQLSHCLSGFGMCLALWLITGSFCLRRLRPAFVLEIVDMEAQHVAIINGVGDGVGMQLLFKNVFGGFVGAHGAVNLLVAGVVFKDRRAGKAEQLCLGEKRLDGLVVVAKLGAVAFVKDDDDALVTQRLQPLLVGLPAFFLVLLRFFAGFVQRQAELLDGGDYDLVGVILG